MCCNWLMPSTKAPQTIDLQGREDGNNAVRDVHQQLGAAIRFEWGPTGADALATSDGCLVVIDVLSFTTSVSIAVSKGTEVFPYRWKDETAALYAEEKNAVLAIDRDKANEEHPWSLSPAALMEASAVERLVLPSPNGSTVAFGAKTFAVAGCFRNGEYVAGHLYEAGYGTPDRPISVIASGERWESDGSLRPCIEDFLCAGQIISALSKHGCTLSPEARIASNAFKSAVNVPDILRDCASGRELIQDGYGQDVELAAQLNQDDVVPTLTNQRFSQASVSDLIELA